jgi:hypothetical protein
LINDARKSLLKVLGLEPVTPDAFQGWTGVLMSMISFVSMNSAAAARADFHSPKTIALFCYVGLVVSLFLMTQGLDLGPGLA